MIFAGSSIASCTNICSSISAIHGRMPIVSRELVSARLFQKDGVGGCDSNHDSSFFLFARFTSVWLMMIGVPPDPFPRMAHHHSCLQDRAQTIKSRPERCSSRQDPVPHADHARPAHAARISYIPTNTSSTRETSV